jgi:DNA-binding NarL/FixJ family response regulator
MRRAVGELSAPSERALLLPAQVEVMLAVGDGDEARAACEELERIAAGAGPGLLDATAAHARGAIDLAAGDARSALGPLRRAARQWIELAMPYEGARTRTLLGLACRALGDEDSAALDLEAARTAFVALGAAPDVARVEDLARTGGTPGRDAHGLTDRELQVLRLLASGATNKAIAAELVLSERTVDRHVSNIFAKLGVSSRAAATAHAYEHRLV